MPATIYDEKLTLINEYLTASGWELTSFDGRPVWRIPAALVESRNFRVSCGGGQLFARHEAIRLQVVFDEMKAEASIRQAQDCNCERADAWRCARQRGLSGTITCPCKCHRARSESNESLKSGAVAERA